MNLGSTIFFAAAIATTRIILQRADMLKEGITATGLAFAAVIAWLIYDAEADAAPADSTDPTPAGDPASTLTGPASVERWLNEASRAANLTGVSRDLILAVIWQESAGDPSAKGSAGEEGLMQVTEIAAEDVGEVQPTTNSSPQRQITVGAKYLAKCFDYVGGDTFKALRCYNEGPPPLTQTASRQYATEVLQKRERLTDEQ